MMTPNQTPLVLSLSKDRHRADLAYGLRQAQPERVLGYLTGTLTL